MRIAYTCHDSFPSSSTNTQQTLWTILEVARLGVSIDLVVPSVAAGANGDLKSSIARYYGVRPDEWPDSLGVTPLGSVPARGSIRKAWFDWGMASQIARGPGGVDLVWTRDPLAAVSCLRAGLPTVFETYRPDYATRGVFRPWRKACLENVNLRGVIVHSRLAADAYRAAGVPHDRVLVAHNGFAASVMEPHLTREEARRRLALPIDAHLAVYTGHTGPEKGVDTLIDLAADVPSVQVLIVGAVPGSEDWRRLEETARQAAASNVRLLPRVGLAEVAAYVYAADCLLIPPTDAPLRKFRHTVLPMKVFMYLAAGRPILAGHLPDVAEVLTDGETACLVPCDNRLKAAAALVGLLTDRALQDRLSANARAASTQYTWAARAQKIVRFLNGAT